MIVNVDVDLTAQEPGKAKGAPVTSDLHQIKDELARLRARVDELTADKETLWAERTTLVTCLGLEDALVNDRVTFVAAVLSAACKSADFLAGFKAARDRAFALVRDSAELDPIECSRSIRNMRPDNATTPRAKLLKEAQQP